MEQPRDAIKVLGRRNGMLILGLAEEIEEAFLTKVDNMHSVPSVPTFSAS